MRGFTRLNLFRNLNFKNSAAGDTPVIAHLPTAGMCAIYQVDLTLYHRIVTRRDLPHWIMSNEPVQHSDWWLP